MKRLFYLVYLAAGLLFAASTAHAAAPRNVAMDCGGLKGLALKDTQIEVAEVVSAGEKFDFPPSVFNVLAKGKPYVEKVSFCRVAGTIGRAMKFEIWLPEDWNGRFMAQGNAGYTGGINYPHMRDALDRGFATASSDLGHESKDMNDVTWMHGHNQDLINFGYRAHHLLAERAKQIIQAYYLKSARYNYFNGCSSGGWQGLTEAQKFPDDYDGIIAGAPAHDFVRLQAKPILQAQMRMSHPEGDLTQEQSQALAAAAIAKCDPEDGVTDGLISHPLSCDFDPKELQCPARGEKPDNCLSEAQVTRARSLYGEQSTEKGLRLYPGPAYGVPVQASNPRPVAETGLVRALDSKPDWDEKTFDPDKDIPQLESVFASDMSAMNPDLRIYYSNGGKIIVYQGWMDPGISPYHALQYRQMVEQKLGSGITNSFYRVFMVPGMGHCGGGPGPDQFDMITAMQNWVEDGKAPERIVASKVKDGKVTRSRPLCAFPKIPVYNGTGSTDSAQNFSCKAP